MSHNNAITIINPDDGRRYRLNIKGEIGRLTIGRLKECLASVSSCQFPPADQVIKLNGTPLTSDEDVCATYGITNGSTLTLEHRRNVDPMSKTNMASFASPQRRALEYQTIRQQEINLGNALVASDNTLQEKIEELQDKLREAEKKKMDLTREKRKAERELQKVREQEELAERERQHLAQLQQQEAQRAVRRAADLAARREQLKAEEAATRTVALQKLENERRKAMLGQQRAEYEAEKQRLAKEREAYEQRAKEREIKIREKEMDIEQKTLSMERDRRELEFERLVSHKNRVMYYNRLSVPPPPELQHADTMAVDWADRIPSLSSSSLPLPRAHLNDGNKSNNNRVAQEQEHMMDSRGPNGLNVSGGKQTPHPRQPMHVSGNGQHPPGLLNTEDNTPASAYANHSVQCESLGRETARSMRGGMGRTALMPGIENSTLAKDSELYDTHENALDNLLYLGQDLGLEDPLEFDANNTCVISIDGKYTLLVTFDTSTKRLYMYSTLLTAIPKDPVVRLRLYELLMEGALLGREMCGGGVGASVKNDFILISTSIYLPTSHPTTLRILTPHFVFSLSKWREKLQELLENVGSKQEEATTIVPPHAALGENSDAAPSRSVQRTTREHSVRRSTASSQGSCGGVDNGIPVLGIEATDSVIMNGVLSRCKDGVLVVNVMGPAALAGIQPNDRIRRVNGKLVTGLQQFQREVSHLVPDTAVPVVLDRGGVPLVVSVKVGSA